jgi:hypothetical protein
MWSAAPRIGLATAQGAARTIAFAENRAIFDGYAAADIGGIRPGASNEPVPLPTAVAGYPAIVAQAVDRLRLAGVEGPYRLVLGDDPFTAISGGSEEGYPVLQHINRLVDGDIIWAPGIMGGVVLTTRGGDFELDLGQDLSIGYLSHTAEAVELYLGAFAGGAESYAKDLGQRYSPVRLMCSHPNGETWASRSGAIWVPLAARVLTTSPSFMVFQNMMMAASRFIPAMR